MVIQMTDAELLYLLKLNLGKLAETPEKRMLPSDTLTLDFLLAQVTAAAARKCLEILEPKWLDRPDSDGAWWICLENEMMDLVHVKLADDCYIINEGMKTIGTFAEEKYAKAVIPQPPKKEPG